MAVAVHFTDPFPLHPDNIDLNRRHHWALTVIVHPAANRAFDRLQRWI